MASITTIPTNISRCQGLGFLNYLTSHDSPSPSDSTVGKTDHRSRVVTVRRDAEKFTVLTSRRSQNTLEKKIL